MLRNLAVLLLLLLATSQATAQTFEEIRTQALEVLASMKIEPKVVRSKHFHILYVGNRNFAELRRENLELTYRNLRVFVQNKLKMKVNLKHEPLVVILLDTQEQMIDFGRRTGTPLSEGVAGYYVPSYNWSVFFNQRNSNGMKALYQQQRNLERSLNAMGSGNTVRIPDGNGRIRRVSKDQIRQELRNVIAAQQREMRRFNIVVTQHEGTHHIAHNIGVQQRGADYPFWVSEGLASLFETPPRARGASIQGAGKTNRERLSAYRKLVKDGTRLGLLKMIRNPRGAQAAVSIDAAYAESWAAVQFLFHRRSKEFRDYLHALAARESEPTEERSRSTRRRGTGTTERRNDELALFESYFGDVDELQAEMDKYLERLK